MSARSLKFILSLGGVVALGSAAASLAMAGGIGSVYGSSHLPAPPARKAARKKRNHVLSVDYKSSIVNVGLTNGLPPNTIELFDTATLAGRPFGKRKPTLNEDSFLTYNQSDPIGTGDFSGRYHDTFEADFIGSRDGFRGFYDYTVDANGNPSSPINGVITGGSGTFRGARGSFAVLDLVDINPSSITYRARWKGSLRY